MRSPSILRILWNGFPALNAGCDSTRDRFDDWSKHGHLRDEDEVSFFFFWHVSHLSQRPACVDMGTVADGLPGSSGGGEGLWEGLTTGVWLAGDCGGGRPKGSSCRRANNEMT